MKASVETSEANVTQMKSDVSTMKASVEGTKTEVEGLKSDVTNLKAQTQTIVDNAKEEVTGLLDTKADVTYVDGELAKKVNYSDSLTYEEIMATNPVPDLTNKVASASVLKTLSDNLNSFSVLKSNYSGSQSWNIDDLDSYPKGAFMLHSASFSGNATGTKPFSDGHLLTFIWRNIGSQQDILSQIAVEDNVILIKMRKYSDGAWSAWKSISIS